MTTTPNEVAGLIERYRLALKHIADASPMGGGSQSLAYDMAKVAKQALSPTEATEPLGESDPYEGHAAREGMVHAPVGDEALVERVARAICRVNTEQRCRQDPMIAPVRIPEAVECQVENGWDLWSPEARAAIQAIPAPATAARQSPDSGMVEALRSLTSGEIVGMTLGDEGTPEYADAFKSGWQSAMDLVAASLPKSPSDGESE